MTRKNRLIGANASDSALITATATRTSATACRIDSLAPNTRLNRYSVGMQIASVTRNRTGSFTADDSACRKLDDAPRTAP